ncbi:MAG: TRAM domain-containing protein [Candidatus Aerophobetes bacterium]|nr:TRAM domain-containing protein [Candidatus Aerophobetes bacterium]
MKTKRLSILYIILFIVLVGIVCYGTARKLGFNPLIPTITGVGIATSVVIIEQRLSRTSVRKLIIGGIGFGGGALVGSIIAYPLLLIPFLKPFSPFLLFLINIMFAGIGLTVFIKRDEEITNFIAHISGKKSYIEERKYKILDTSVIIDGRIADLCESSFIEGTLVIPRFILAELQQIADSSSSTKRTRGRRGLDMVKKLQDQEIIPVEILDRDFPATQEVDAKLIQLAKSIGGEIVTNDHNLKKVAKIQDVKVLNINEIATALKPILLPGESLEINILKEGENPNQGVAYLEDGTMVVVEGGKNYIGKKKKVSVTSVLQTPTGKMIFTEIKKDEVNRKKTKKRR